MRYLLLISIFLVGCNENTPSKIQAPIKNDAGQYMVYIPVNNFIPWFQTNKGIRIVTMTGFTISEGTNGYVIVYVPISEKE